jgi:hypothetical protein
LKPCRERHLGRAAPTGTGQCFVTLEVGSGLESDYQLKSSLSCHFFNLWKFTSWNQWQSQV